MSNDTATEKAGSAENRDNTIAYGRHAAALPRRSSYLVLARVMLAENLADLLGKSLVTGRPRFVAELLWLR